MSDLLYIVPSRGRPHKMLELLCQWDVTKTGDSRLLIPVDDDDPELPGYQALEIPEWAELVVGPRLRLNPTLNQHAVERGPDHFAVGFMGDDHRPRTRGWDESIVAALREMGSGIVYGNDLVQGENLPTAVAMTSDIVRALGYFSPPECIHMHLDNAWLALGEGLERIRYLPDVVIEHLHPVARTAAWDERYAEVNSSEMYAHDRAVFERWLSDDFEAACERVNVAIGAVTACA